MKDSQKLPGWVERLTEYLCGPYWSEGLQGDMLENLEERAQRLGRLRSRLWMYLELLLLLRFIFYRKDRRINKNSNIMLSEYFKIGFRVMVRDKVYSFINLFGLGAGIACALLIYIWIQDELSYDRFHENEDELYRIEFETGNVARMFGSPGELGPEIRAQIPEVSQVTRVMSPRNGLIVQHDDLLFHEPGYSAVDPDFLTMFSFKLLEGSPETALSDPYSIVLTQSMAKKYFGEENALGKTLKVNNEYLMTVKGVLDDVPSNSSIRFDYLINFDFVKILNWYTAEWSSVWLQTYVRINAGANTAETSEKILETIMRGTHNRWDEEYVKALVMNPLSKMRLMAYSYTGSGFARKTLESLYTFSALGALILFIACINFMNLATARSAKRAKEIGMRKVFGAVRQNIKAQFIGEALLQTILSLVLALALVSLLLGPFNQISGKSIGLESLLNPGFLLGVICIALVVALLAGSYPAFYLSRFQPIKVLKGHLTAGLKSVGLRKILVVIQFGLSIFLIIATLVIYRQMDYVRNKDLGYDKDLVVYIPLVHEKTREAYDALKTEWKSWPEISSVTAAQVKPSFIGWSSSAYWEGKDPDDHRDVYHNRVDMDYLKTMGVQLIEGRDFSEEFRSDNSEDGQGGMIINETLAFKMNEEGKALGMNLKTAGAEGPVVGIMKDFHFSSLKSQIEPLAILLNPSSKAYAVMKLNGTNIRETIQAMEESWYSVLPNFPFEFHFLDEDFEAVYRSDERLGRLLGTFSILAIIIACLGLFGLASFTAEERKKEVAIRKVLGAHQWRLTYLLCRDFILLVLVANLLAWPLGRWIMGDWLNGFAYRISLGWEVFAAAAILALLIAIVTIVFQTFRVAVSNPVEALKYE